MLKNMRDKNKFRGCLIGGAIGDALGYAVEFMHIDRILQKYGENGITSYELKNGIAEISDDTQMTLFTANGLLVGMTRFSMRGIAGSPESYCMHCYHAWLKTQNETYGEWESKDEDVTTKENPYLITKPELYYRRAPGNTILRVLNNKLYGTIDKPVNDSKGCGGVMRVAPIGLYFNNNDFSKTAMYGAENAALTHGHDLGYIPAAALVYIINRIMYDEKEKNIEIIINDCVEEMNLMFSDKPHIKEFVDIMEKAIKLSKTNKNDIEAITEIGEGWVAEETLAIAVYCSLKYKDDFEKAIIASVNHSGDSDSTGSVTGNILGTIHGFDGLPEKYLLNLELKDIILEMADDLFNDCQIYEFKEGWTAEDEKWYKKYCC